MLELGRINQAVVARRADIGAFIDGGELGEILLPRRYVDDNMQVGDEIAVFVYRDSEDRLVATSETPRAQVGECAHLRVVDVDRNGAFLDWGLPKDLFVPFGEQQKTMQKGYSYTVYLFVDESTQRIVASSKLEKHLVGDVAGLAARQAVNCLVYGRSDLGFKAVIENRWLGQFYDNETFRRLHYGEPVQAFIKQLRPDGKIDLVLQLPSRDERDRLGEAIIEHLKLNRGISSLTDKSPPDDIYREFGVSKANFKKALGRLYRERVIVIEKELIRLA